MKKKNFLWSLLILLMSVTMCAGFTSCSHDDHDDPPVIKDDGGNNGGNNHVQQLTITNNSTYTLPRFTVVFLNSRMEILTTQDKGTLDPGYSVSVEIPTAAKEYYMATYLNGKYYFSANYDITYSSMRLTNAEVGLWSANSSLYRYPMAKTND